MSGLASGKGTSGTTAWNNSVRSRLYFAKPKGGDEGEDDDTDLRELTLMKANFAQAGEKVALVYQDGVFVRPGQQSPHAAASQNTKADDIFMTLLGNYQRSGRNLSPNPSANYAPALFEKDPLARQAGIRKNALADAMARLFEQGRIETVQDGPASRRRSLIQPKAPPPASTLV